MADRPRSEDRLGRAAGLGPVGLGVGPQLHRHGDDLGARLALVERRDGAVDAARDGDEHAIRIGIGEGEPARGQRRKRPVQRIGGEHGRVPRRRRQAAQSLRHVIGGDRRGREDAPPSTSSATQAQAALVAAQPSASKVTAAMRVPVRLDRDPREIAAGGTTGSAAERAGARGAWRLRSAWYCSSSELTPDRVKM